MTTIDLEFRIALAQIVCRQADIEHNLEEIAATVRRALDVGCQHVVFPELALSGYLVDPRFSEAAVRLDAPPMQQLRKLSQEISITVGFVEETPTHIFYNSAGHFRGGRLVHLHRKIYLPTYGMFDERRYYGAGWEVSGFDTAGGRMAALICGDAWHLPLPYLAVHDGADVLLILAASSRQGLAGTAGAEDAWLQMCRSYALTLSSCVVFVNQANDPDRDDGADFWGGSFVSGPDGAMMCTSQTDGPDLITCVLDPADLRRQRIRLPFRRDDSLAHTLTLGQRILQQKIDRDAVVSLADRDADLTTTTTIPPKPR